MILCGRSKKREREVSLNSMPRICATTIPYDDGCSLLSLRQEVEELEADMNLLRIEQAARLAEEETAQQIALLRQVAYAMAEAAELCVYGPEGAEDLVPPSLSQLNKRADVMTTE